VSAGGRLPEHEEDRAGKDPQGVFVADSLAITSNKPDQALMARHNFAAATTAANCRCRMS